MQAVKDADDERFRRRKMWNAKDSDDEEKGLACGK